MTRCHSYSPMPPPPQNNSRRHNAWLASKSGDSQLEAQAAKLAKDARRRRVELRRIRSFSQALSAAEASTDFNLDLGGGPTRCRSYGKISVVGRGREMNDVLAVELGFLKRGGDGNEIYDLFGVFDGREGRRTARACSQVLHQILAEVGEEEGKNEIDWEEVMLEAFDVVEARINKNGSAAAGTIAVVGEKEVVVAAKCEGSKAVLCSGGVAVRLMGDDQSSSSSSSNSRMHNINREQGQVQVGVTRRRRADEFLILGSFGFWDVVSDSVACEIASGAADGSGGAEAAAALMAKFAMAQGSRDNISVILVDLRAASDELQPAST